MENCLPWFLSGQPWQSDYIIQLFVQAWSKAVVPANIISGFQTCGVYPLNDSTIRVAKTRPEGTFDRDCNAESHDTNIDDNCVASTDESSNEFTSEQDMLFQKRYEEGYNLYIDADCIRWLRLHHLEVNISIPTEQDSGSLLDASPDIIPINLVQIEFPKDEVNDGIHH